jgi:WD40 repeat protein
MATKSVSKFSINGEYFGYGSPDGTLKLWQTTNGILKQEYTHSTHLTAVCSCIGWGPVKKVKTMWIPDQSKNIFIWHDLLQPCLCYPMLINGILAEYFAGC